MLLTAIVLAQATGPDLPSAWGIVQTGGVAALLFLGLYLVFSGRIPTKQQLQQLAEQLEAMTVDRDFWRGLALKGTSLAESHIKVTDEEVAMRVQVLETNMDQRLKGIETLLQDKGTDGT